MKGFRDQPIRGSNDAVFNSTNNQIRLYTVPRAVKTFIQDSTRKADWKEAGPEAVSNFSAVAYHYGKILQEQLKVPVGLINISYGGSSAEAWMSVEALKAFPELTIPTLADSSKVNNRTPTTLYNAMLKPFIGYAIKGSGTRARAIMEERSSMKNYSGHRGSSGGRNSGWVSFLFILHRLPLTITGMVLMLLPDGPQSQFCFPERCPKKISEQYPQQWHGGIDG